MTSSKTGTQIMLPPTGHELGNPASKVSQPTKKHSDPRLKKTQTGWIIETSSTFYGLQIERPTEIP